MSSQSELDTLLLKISSLIESIHLYLESQLPDPDIFNILLSKYVSLSNEMATCKLLKSLVLVPKAFIPEDPEFIPRVLLRTKLIPELERPLAPVNLLDENLMTFQLREQQVLAELYDQLIQSCIKINENLSQEVDVDDRDIIEETVANTSYIEDQIRLMSRGWI